MRAAVIFDMDGVVAESESLHMIAFQRTLARKGMPIELAYFHSFVGLSTEENVRQLNEDFGLELPIAATAREKNDELLRVIAERGIDPLPGVGEAWARLRRGRVPLAVGSSSVRRIVQAVLGGALQALEQDQKPDDFFQAIIGGDQVAHKKPAPDIYLAAAQALGADPARCVAIEDSEAGVRSAKAAGMRCIAIPSEFTREHDLSAADCQAASMVEVLEADFYGFLAAT